MKRAPTLVAALAVAASVTCAIAGCTGSGVPMAPTSFVGQWKLVSGSDGDGRLTLDGTYITLTVHEGESASGRGPCGDYRMKIIGRPGPVFLSVTDETIAMCTDAKSPVLDHRYLAALHASSVGGVDGNRLSFSSPTTKLAYRRVPHLTIDEIVDIRWRAQSETFTEPDGATAHYLDPAGSLLLSGNNTFGIGVGACPALTGSWTQDAGEIILDHVSNATSKCTTPDDSQNRTDVMSALSQGFQVSVKDGTLIATNPRTHTSMSFREEGIGPDA